MQFDGPHRINKRPGLRPSGANSRFGENMWLKIWKAIKGNILGVSIGVIGIMSSIISYFIKANLDTEFISLRVSLIVFTFFIIILVLMYIIIRQQNMIENEASKIAVRRYIKEQNIFLISSAKIIKISTILAMYYDKGDYQIPIGILKVINDNGKVLQTVLVGTTNGFSDNNPEIMRRINENDALELQRLLVEDKITDELLLR